ncbi:MAG: hypothetical protein FWB78_10170, partial [Treponema sp.]|nr:hypothetical protein [Treponema sp.]
MYLQRASGNTVPEQPRQNVSSPHKTSASVETKASPLPATAKPAMPSSPAPHSVHTLIAAAGLPADRLSASIVSFARFFSLPIKPELMAAIRQQVFSQPMPTPTPTAQAAMPTA